jgi:hypothetical protein
MPAASENITSIHPFHRIATISLFKVFLTSYMLTYKLIPCMNIFATCSLYNFMIFLDSCFLRISFKVLKFFYFGLFLLFLYFALPSLSSFISFLSLRLIIHTSSCAVTLIIYTLKYSFFKDTI